jgi:competence protein ComGC
MLQPSHEPEIKTHMNTSPPAPVAQSKTSGLAITSLVLGIMSVVLVVICIGPLFGIPAIILGHIACAKINRSGGALSGKGLAIAGFATGYVSLALMLAMLPIAIPNFIKARDTALKNGCINNLRQIDGAKQQWALANGKTADDTPASSDLSPLIKNGVMPQCPAGGTYTIGPMKEAPVCSKEGHALDN